MTSPPKVDELTDGEVIIDEDTGNPAALNFFVLVDIQKIEIGD